MVIIPIWQFRNQEDHGEEPALMNARLISPRQISPNEANSMGSWTTARNSPWVFGGFLCVSFFYDATLQHVVLDLVSWHHRVRDGRVCWRPRLLRLEDDSTDSLSMCLPTVGEACQTTWILFSIEKVAESLDLPTARKKKCLTCTPWQFESVKTRKFYGKNWSSANPL